MNTEQDTDPGRRRRIGRLYRLAPALRPAPGTDYLDLGLCRLLLPPAPSPGFSPGTPLPSAP